MIHRLSAMPLQIIASAGSAPAVHAYRPYVCPCLLPVCLSMPIARMSVHAYCPYVCPCVLSVLSMPLQIIGAGSAPAAACVLSVYNS